LIRYCREKGYSLEKTIEFLDAIGSYDRMFVYRSFQVPSSDEEQSNANENEKKPSEDTTKGTNDQNPNDSHKTVFCRQCGGEIYEDAVICPHCGNPVLYKKGTSDQGGFHSNSMPTEHLSQKKGKLNKWVTTVLFIIVIAVLISLGTSVVNNSVERGNHIDILEWEIPIFLENLEASVYYINAGRDKISEGFQEYLDSLGNYYSSPDIDEVLEPYISSAESKWWFAESYMNVMATCLDNLKPIVKTEVYDKFVDVYSALEAYKEGVQPYGKSALEYRRCKNDSEIKISGEIASFKSHINVDDDYSEYLK